MKLSNIIKAPFLALSGLALLVNISCSTLNPRAEKPFIIKRDLENSFIVGVCYSSRLDTTGLYKYGISTVHYQKIVLNSNQHNCMYITFDKNIGTYVLISIDVKAQGFGSEIVEERIQVNKNSLDGIYRVSLD